MRHGFLARAGAGEDKRRPDVGILARRAAWTEGTCRRPRFRTVDTPVASPATDKKPHLWFPVILRFRACAAHIPGSRGTFRRFDAL